MRKTAMAACIGLAAGSLVFGCVKQPQLPPPLTYLASERPTAPIAMQQWQIIEKSFSRGGWYFFNNNFRPAPDVGSYVREAEKEANANGLKHADVELAPPLLLVPILLLANPIFGWNGGTDVLRSGSQQRK